MAIRKNISYCKAGFLTTVANWREEITDYFPKRRNSGFVEGDRKDAVFLELKALHEFNQLILKAVFMGLPIERVMGLERRANAELTRMCEDFAEEQIAAGRPVPVDLWLALGPCASPRGERLLLAYVRDEDPRQRYYATLALFQRQAVNPGLRTILGERLDAETDERVRSVLRAGLAS